jgi:hypothetical protein
MLMDNYQHLLLQDGHVSTTRGIMAAFQQDLRALSDSVQAWNKDRRFPTRAFDPSIMTSSVSI